MQDMETRIQDTIRAEKPAASAAPPSPKLKPGTQTDFFVGRGDVIKEVEDAFPEEHFVYLYGPGGIGKSTLVRQIFDDLDEADWTGDGAQYLDLATADSGSAVLDRIVQQLSLPGNVRDGGSLATHLAQRPQKLYVLDDVEQALAGDEADGTSTTLSLLRALESTNVGVHFLVTCRSEVNVGHGIEVKPLRDDEAAKLFKTTATHKGYTWTDGDDDALATFIPELDGHPLSIDIAARVAQNYASVAALSEAWTTRRTEILEVHPAFGAPDKDDSLHTSLDLSYHALPDDARGTLARQIFALLADLPAGANLDFLRKVFDADPTHAARLLERRSLVTCEDGRFRLLAPIRYYAERTQDSEHVTRHDKRRDRMESVLLSRVEELFNGRFWSEVSPKTKDEIVIEADNVEAAVDRAVDEERHRFVLRATKALGSYYASNPHLDRSVRAFKQQRDAACEADVAFYEAKASFELGRVARYRGDPSSAREHLTRARDLYREVDDRLGEANALKELGILDRLHDRPADARNRLTQARDLYRDIHDRLGEANALKELGSLDRDTEHTESARERLCEAIEIYREIQSTWNEGQAVDALADLERKEDNDETATELYREALQLFRTSQNRTLEAFALTDLAEMAVAREDAETALERFAAAAELFGELGRLGPAIQSAQNASVCAAHIGDEETAQRWHDRASEWQAESDTPAQE
jgi:tetratricopeptide (TPR) repeat protein